MRLSALAYSEHLIEHLAEESAATLSFWRDRAERGAAAATMATFVAEGESGFAGIVDGFLSEDGGTVEIGGMWVAPSLRRSGVGRELLAAVCEWARERGAERAGLWVRAANDAARSLYQGEGFELARTSNETSQEGCGWNGSSSRSARALCRRASSPARACWRSGFARWGE